MPGATSVKLRTREGAIKFSPIRKISLSDSDIDFAVYSEYGGGSSNIVNSAELSCEKLRGSR